MTFDLAELRALPHRHGDERVLIVEHRSHYRIAQRPDTQLLQRAQAVSRMGAARRHATRAQRASSDTAEHVARSVRLPFARSVRYEEMASIPSLRFMGCESF